MESSDTNERYFFQAAQVAGAAYAAEHGDDTWCIESIEAACLAYERALWRPIAEAPRDEVVLVYAAPRDTLPGIVVPTLWHPDAGWCVCELREVTHFRPLPTGPEEL